MAGAGAVLCEHSTAWPAGIIGGYDIVQPLASITAPGIMNHACCMLHDASGMLASGVWCRHGGLCAVAGEWGSWRGSWLGIVSAGVVSTGIGPCIQQACMRLPLVVT